MLDVILLHPVAMAVVMIAVSLGLWEAKAERGVKASRLYARLRASVVLAEKQTDKNVTQPNPAA